MEKFTVKAASGSTDVLIGEKTANLKNYIRGRNTIIITDNNVASHYGKLFEGYKTIVIKTGEDHKNLQSVEFIYKKLFEYGADRRSLVIGIGGGVVTDITGFASATYMRGLSYGFVSTTLLAQVDASIGGKNGVNFMGAKNIIGTFTQPEFVVIDTDTLNTIPVEEITSGMGEILKHCIISGGKIFDTASDSVSPDNTGRIKITGSGGEDLLPFFISESIKIKAEVVANDERESGQRRILNLGHTVAHAIEIGEKLPHGIAVIKGIKFASDFSVAEGFLDKNESMKITALLKKTGVDLEINAERKQIINLLQHDKKKENSDIYFVFIRKPGDVFSMKIRLEKLIGALDDLRIGR